MGRKNFSYWLKGGAIGALVGFLYYLFLYVIEKSNFLRVFSYDFFQIAFFLLSIVIVANYLFYVKLFDLELTDYSFPITESNFFVWLLVIIEFFVIGSLIGFIIGKIKSKNIKEKKK